MTTSHPDIAADKVAKERPILFSGPMVRALLADSKTQTRRALKPQPYVDSMGNACWNGRNFGQNIMGTPLFSSIASPFPSSDTGRVHCPYGKPGDRLWVRESGARMLLAAPEDPAQPGLFRHDVPATPAGGIYWVERTQAPGAGYSIECTREQFLRHHTAKAVPSIHMPRWASRILLEITEVRFERLQDISEADAEAEGVDFLRHVPDADETLTAKQLYECLWDSINTKPGTRWSDNPWVWCVSFRIASPITTSAKEAS